MTITAQLTIITASEGNGSSYRLNQEYNQLQAEGCSRILYIQSTDRVKPDWTQLGYLFVNDVAIIQNQDWVEEFIALIQSALGSSVKVVMAYSCNQNNSLPPYLTGLTDSLEIIRLPEPTRQLVEQTLRKTFESANESFEENDLQEFLKEPFENLRTSEAKFMALVSQRYLEKRGVWNKEWMGEIVS